MSDPGSPHPDESTLNEYAEGCLPKEQAMQMAIHLAACESCAREEAALRQLFVALEVLPELPPPRSLAPAVMAALRPPSTPFPPHITLLVSLQSLAALFFLVVAWPYLAPALPDLEMAMLPRVSLELNWLPSTVALEEILRHSLRELEAWLPVLPLHESAFLLVGSLFIWLLGNGLLLRLPSLPMTLRKDTHD